ncbi:MAG: hypothetical protein IBJ03_14635 [Gemmatimonadaceae bacterium]|nr:hypothetical protein [Gemmatimonadaceae bacterium]
MVLMLGWQSSVAPAAEPSDSLRAVRQEAGQDSVRQGGPVWQPAALTSGSYSLDTTTHSWVPQDTIRQRARAVEYSDAYYKRLAVHRALSWAMLPLFAASYVSGDQLLSKGDDAPQWARNVHPVAATGAAVLFGANTVTGVWNLWEGRKDENGRKRRLLHSAMFLAASGGFTYAGSVLAEQAEESAEKRRQHRTVALSSMGLSTASWLLMKIGN